MTREAIESTYKSPVSQKGDYRPMLRTKINTTGSNAVRCWNERGERVELPDDLRGYDLVPRVHVSHMWFTGSVGGCALSQI